MEHRYEFIMLFDVENGNPNGDPDAGNMPRVDGETSIGLATDVCLKRKIRNFVEVSKEGEAGFNILVKADRALNTKFTEAYEEEGLKLGGKGKDKDIVEQARDYICKNYYDVRTFGAVMSTGDNPCGIVRGPVQLNFAQSIDPVLPQEMTITRQAVTTEKDFEKSEHHGTMGKKNYIPYGLYRGEGYVSAMLAKKTGFDHDDLELLFQSIENMFEIDHSAARGKMCLRKLYVFEHESPLGNAPSHVLFDKIKIKSPDYMARKFTDYSITVEEMPSGVRLIERV